jgi:hypothetical protein
LATPTITSAASPTRAGWFKHHTPSLRAIAKQSRAAKEVWIASSLALLAMTNRKIRERKQQ